MRASNRDRPCGMALVEVKVVCGFACTVVVSHDDDFGQQRQRQQQQQRLLLRHFRPCVF